MPDSENLSKKYLGNSNSVMRRTTEGKYYIIKLNATFKTYYHN